MAFESCDCYVQDIPASIVAAAGETAERHAHDTTCLRWLDVQSAGADRLAKVFRDRFRRLCGCGSFRPCAHRSEFSERRQASVFAADDEHTNLVDEPAVRATYTSQDAR